MMLTLFFYRKHINQGASTNVGGFWSSFGYASNTRLIEFVAQRYSNPSTSYKGMLYDIIKANILDNGYKIRRISIKGQMIGGTSSSTSSFTFLQLNVESIAIADGYISGIFTCSGYNANMYDLVYPNTSTVFEIEYE